MPEHEQKWTPTPFSSNVAAVARDGRAVLVQFTNGATYTYDHVPDDVWDALANVVYTHGSVGRFIARRLKGHYPARRHEGT